MRGDRPKNTLLGWSMRKTVITLGSWAFALMLMAFLVITAYAAYRAGHRFGLFYLVIPAALAAAFPWGAAWATHLNEDEEDGN